MTLLNEAVLDDHSKHSPSPCNMHGDPQGGKPKPGCCFTTQEKVKQQLLTRYTFHSAAVKNRPPSSRWHKSCVSWADRHFPSSWSHCSQTYSQNRLHCAEPTYHEQVVNSHILQCSISLKKQGILWQAPSMITQSLQCNRMPPQLQILHLLS